LYNNGGFEEACQLQEHIRALGCALRGSTALAPALTPTNGLPFARFCMALMMAVLALTSRVSIINAALKKNLLRPAQRTMAV
jgi:hypothetical protein